MFSFAHIISVIVSAISIFFIVKFFKKKDNSYTLKFLQIVCIIILLLNPINWAYEIIVYGELNLALSLPLHLCSIYWFLFPFAVFLKKDSTFRQISLASCATIGIIGGILGLLMNSHLSLHPFISFPVLRSILYHFLMILAAILLWTKNVYKPKKMDVYTNYIPVIVLIVICCVVEQLYGLEYCYVRDGAGTPLTIISSIMPRFAYLTTIYLVLYFFIRFGFYNKFFAKELYTIK